MSLDLESRVENIETLSHACGQNSTRLRRWNLAKDILRQVIRLLKMRHGVFKCLWPQYMAGRQSLWSDNPDIVGSAVSLLSCFMLRALLHGSDAATNPAERAQVMLQVDRCDKLQHIKLPVDFQYDDAIKVKNVHS